MSESEKGTSRPEAAVAARLDGEVVIAVAKVTVVDLALLASCTTAGVHPYLILVAHFAAVTLGVRYMAPSGSTDRLTWPLGVVLLLVAGPLGGAGMIVLAALTKMTTVDRSMLADWYETLNGDERPEKTRAIHESLLAGREFKPKSGGPRSFADLLEHGTLSEKQALLGCIGLKYHPDYFPLLALALRSPEAGVRAQAAAVFVKLKEGFRHRLHEARAAGRQAQLDGNGPAMLSAAHRMVECAASGFLDLSDAREARLEAESICHKSIGNGADQTEADLLACRIAAATGGGEDTIERMMQKLPALTTTLRDELARCLVAAGRHGDLSRLLNTFPPVARLQPVLAPMPYLPPDQEARR